MAEATYIDGPDQIIPCDEHICTDLNGVVKLRIPENGKAIETIKPISAPGLLMRTASEYPDKIALAYKDNGKWENVTYKQYLENVRTCAKGFLQLGLEPGHSVCILGFNSPEWFYSHLAAIFAGGVSVGIYTTNSPKACHYCADNSKANIIVVEDEKQLAKILEVRSQLPKLKAIVQYSGEITHPDVISWKRLMEIGAQQADDDLNSALKKVASNKCCTLVYTSGTVGNPKGVMLSHDNMTWNALALLERLGIVAGSGERVVSYLPLSHVAAQIVDIYIMMTIAGTIYFADKDALKGSLINTLQEVEPTKFLGVPRVYEKIYEKMMQIAAKNGTVRKYISGWAKKQALQHHIDSMNGIKSYTWGYALAKNLIFSKVKEALGLSKCTYFVSAAAPLSTDIKRYFHSIDIPIMECFGMSEASGGHSIGIEGATNFESIGMTIPGMKTKLFNVEDGQGEICLFGRHVFMGYLDEPQKTTETIDEEGWLHTGDLGRIDDKGFIYITGRIKELLVTAGGENIPPVPIEQQVKSELPHISNAFLIGDKRKFLSILVSLKTEVDPDTGVPLGNLTSGVKQWLQSLECPAETVKEVLAAGPDKRLMDELMRGIERVNKNATSNAQTIKKVAVLPADFSVPTGELGPTMKVKRRIVEQKYADIIEKMYS
ncbi:very long-chain-fatty-acid--CoA ligase bubblegum-like isoform X2 [Diorhabda sublineata]|uniref:very long-chain-fatty-acid--CoA ligase bubblegum-like isoform X2 n=1 Tax=Diorhabda sublineata TaxID=1163346 RepID=UPI0024E07036|nr:very long-chain-fatty-acid--CoA ligase bubblegum-like isoform X2 [Diorhabda sublineata]XP_056637859.1 very long-chain-fatty-acid--CoA ligase bubblegum-like isoform X2 [Diorhabda sublineata]